MSAALPIIRGAFQDVGALDPLDSLPAEWADDGLRRLNAMVSGWKTQPLATTLTTERYLFNTQANKQTYFLGLGAEFNLARPQRVDGAALLLNGLAAQVTVTSVTRTGDVATVTSTAHGFSVNNQVFVYGQDCDPAYNGTQVITAVTSNTFTYTILGNPPSPASGTITTQAFQNLNSQVEIPIAMLTDDAYQSIRVKGMSNSQYTQAYYQATQPYGTLYLWPMPTTGDNAIVLYLATQFQGFANLTRDYTFADVAGYEEALEYNLATRLATPYGRDLPTDIAQLAVKSLASVKRKNYTITDVASDAALATSGDRRYGYNIQTGNL